MENLETKKRRFPFKRRFFRNIRKRPLRPVHEKGLSVGRDLRESFKIHAEGFRPKVKAESPARCALGHRVERDPDLNRREHVDLAL